ncbi:hypothetical protein [Streptomyces sp. URMC 123]|uniref:hypothetical protein n=1 Tax=Streptomyces sp. URMC 123 TaxID=3423403 RepID=UPI003F1A3520
MLADPFPVRSQSGTSPWHRHPVVVIIVVLLLALLNYVIPVQEVIPAAAALFSLLWASDAQRQAYGAEATR